MTLKEAHDVSINESIFIKPLEIKLFTGFVMDGMQHSSIAGLPEDTIVIAYEVIENIESEWRIYVREGSIIDSRNYSGDFMISPDYEYVLSVIKSNKDFPSSYTIDIGILGDGDNCVIEFNDMWAIGNYGVPNDIYLRMLKKRYFEIMS